MEESVQNQIARLSTLKLKPYKKFIKALLRIEEQGLVFEKDYRKLCALFKGRIMLYLKKECARAILAHLMAIGRCVGRGNESSRLREELRTPVLAIINMLMENMGFGGKLNETLIKDMEKEEDAFFPQLFRQAIKEALDNVLVNYSDYCLFNRGVYEQREDGEYIVFPFLNNYPYGCKIMIGPFTKKADTTILFQLYVPRYVHRGMAQQLFVPESETRPDSESVRRSRKAHELSSRMDEMGQGNIIPILVSNREMPLSLSYALDDSCLIELEQEDCYNAYISSFSFNDLNSYAPYRHNYPEIAFALGQRAKYIFLHAMVISETMLLYEYIDGLEKADPAGIYPDTPWKLGEDGDLVCINES
jgi:hypothetical protein